MRAISRPVRDSSAGRRPWWCCPTGTPARSSTWRCARRSRRPGISALRISLPYHDHRMPPELDARRLRGVGQHRPHDRRHAAGRDRRTLLLRLAGTARLYRSRDCRHQPRLVLRVSRYRARCANPRERFQSLLDIFRGCGVDRAFDAPYPAGTRRSASMPIGCARRGIASAPCIIWISSRR